MDLVDGVAGPFQPNGTGDLDRQRIIKIGSGAPRPRNRSKVELVEILSADEIALRLRRIRTAPR